MPTHHGADDDDFFKKRSASSAKKTLIVEKFFKAWGIIMQAHSTRLLYLDLYAGPGTYEADIDGLPEPPATCPASDGTLVSQWKMDDVDPNYNLPHDRDTMLLGYADGNMNGFVTAFESETASQTPRPDRRLPMGYYTRETFPVLYALADRFTVCDHWFASMLSSTWPNRKYFHSATRDADADTQILPGFLGFRTSPVYAALENTPDPRRDGPCLSWRCYFSDLPFLAFWYGFAATHALTNFSHVAQFVDDCREGNLPHVSVIDPPYTLADDHPPHAPALGEKFIGLIVDAVTTSQSWSDTAILIVFDEAGGFYDHVRPPQPEVANRWDDTPLGFRVPALIVSPYSSKRVSHTVYDHTSFAKSLNERWEVKFGDEFDTRWSKANSFWDCVDCNADPLPPGNYTDVKRVSPVAGLDWGTGVYARVGDELNKFEALLERIFVLPQLKALDQRANVFEILTSLEHKVVTQKRMLRYGSASEGTA